MHCSCVRQTDLPHTTRLAADVLYHPERVASFYRHPVRDLASFQSAAGEIEFSAGQRAALIGALEANNPTGPSLRRLAEPGTAVVATGQQVGLFGGPAYTIYKALHAAKLAQWLTGNGVPAVPVFWLATEDHDFAEINHVWVFDSQQRPVKVETVRSAAAQPVGGVTLPSPPVEALRAAMEGLPFCEETARLVEDCYAPGVAMGAGFGALLRRLLGEYDILQVDPMLPEFRQLAAPALRRAIAAGAGLSNAVLQRGRDLAAAGYHAQVHVEEQTSFLFLLENGKRLALRRQGDEYVLNGRKFTAGELTDRAASLSPNAILRPVVQDSMLPTAAYIGGNAEIAYLAQSAVIYDALLGRMPVAVPRSGFTIVDSRSCRLMERYGIGLPDFFHGEEALRQRIAEKLVPQQVAVTLNETAAEMDGALERLRAEMAAFDPTLSRSLDRSARKIRYQIEKTRRKAGREALARDERAARDAASLWGLICPERHLQERLYSILPFLAKHGHELVGQIYEAIDLSCADHRVVAL